MRIIALGTTQFLVSCVQGLIESGCSVVELVSLPKHLLPDNSIDIEKFSVDIGIKYYEIENINSATFKEHIRTLSTDIIFSSWPKIIDSELLGVPTYGVIGTHPTALPFNKGRHPLQWEIVLGLRESKLSFFWMNSGVDSGQIIFQAPYEIKQEDSILTLSERINSLANSSSRSLGEMLVSGNGVQGVAQNELHSNSWRKRDRYDVLIDFRMNANDIIALIRSFTAPYPCASFIFEDKYFNVLNGEVVNPEFHIPQEYLEPGYIFNVDGHFLIIKSACKMLKLHVKQNAEQILSSKKYIHPPGKYLVEYPMLAELFK